LRRRGTVTSRSAPASIALGSILAITSSVRRMRALSSSSVASLSSNRGGSSAGDAMRGDLGVVAEGLHLAREGEHVGPQPQRQVDRRIELRRRRMRLGLVENGEKGVSERTKTGTLA
jgi:hypothetical protein